MNFGKNWPYFFSLCLRKYFFTKLSEFIENSACFLVCWCLFEIIKKTHQCAPVRAKLLLSSVIPQKTTPEIIWFITGNKISVSQFLGPPSLALWRNVFGGSLKQVMSETDLGVQEIVLPRLCYLYIYLDSKKYFH